MMMKDPVSPALDILVAEDEEDVRLAAVQILESRGHRPSQARTGAEVLESLKTADYDVILMDVLMPDMDGITATRMIRANEASDEQTPILAFTAGGPSARPEKCLEAGMDAFLRKPVNPPVLLETVERFGTDRGRADVPDPGPPTSLLRAADGDLRLLSEMAAVFLEFAPLQLRELRLAAATDDPKALADTAAKLRESARVFRADGILIPAERLEFLGSRGITDDTERLVDVVAREVEVLERVLKRVKTRPAGESGKG